MKEFQNWQDFVTYVYRHEETSGRYMIYASHKYIAIEIMKMDHHTLYLGSDTAYWKYDNSSESYKLSEEPNRFVRVIGKIL